MSDAELRVTFAGPLVTYQDGGRIGHMRYGVPASGPMDRVSHAAANVALGRPETSTCIEVSLGGLMLECTAGAVTLAVTGGDFAVDHSGEKSSAWVVLTLRKGERLAVRAGASGSWAYVAFAAEVETPLWLAHSATHSLSGFGGGALGAGQTITLQNAKVIEAREGDIRKPDFLPTEGTARVVMGPQDHHFEDGATEVFLSTPYAFTDNYDRMGVRLKGPTLTLKSALSIPSEPIVRGSLQVSGDGVPTLLLADHQTTGGYPKIATVISADLDGLVQLRGGQTVRFSSVTPQSAVDAARSYASHVQEYLSEIAIPKGTLMDRLMGANLVSGVVSAYESSA